MVRHPAEQDNPIAVVDRIASIVNCVSNSEGPVSVSEVARCTGLPKSTTSRIVKSLVPHGLIEIVDEGLVLGLRFFELGERASRPRDLRRLAHAHLERLRQLTGQTVHLAVLDGQHVVYIEIRRSHHTPQLPSRIGGRVPAHATGVGKALLAFSNPELTEVLIAAGLEKVGPRTIVAPDGLRAELWRIRASGVAREVEESSAGIACVAAPVIIDGSGQPIAAISVSGPVSEINLTKCESVLRETVLTLRSQANRLPRSRRVL